MVDLNVDDMLEIDDEYVFCNPHPQGKLVNDCVKRAITIASGRNYRDIKIELNRFKQVTGAKVFNERNNWRKYIESIGWKPLTFVAVKGHPRIKVNDFCSIYREGTYLLQVSKHVVAVIDGQFYDTWDCRHKMVYKAWVVKAPKGVSHTELQNKTRMVRL